MFEHLTIHVKNFEAGTQYGDITASASVDAVVDLSTAHADFSIIRIDENESEQAFEGGQYVIPSSDCFRPSVSTKHSDDGIIRGSESKSLKFLEGA